MKKTTAILLSAAIVALIAFTGCQKREPEPTESSSKSVSESSAALPNKPTTAEAARNNLAIKSENVHIIQFDEPAEGDRIALLETSEGDIKIRLFSKLAPKTVAEFERLAGEGHYNGQSFGEVVPGYKIEQTGPSGSAKFPADGEFSLDLWNFSGAVALANNGSDFMIVDAKQSLNPESELKELNFPSAVIEKYLEVGGAPHQDWNNTVFGQVIEGMDVVSKIAGGKADENGKPLEPVIIAGISIIDYTAEQDTQGD